MSVITSEVSAQIVELAAEGKAPGKIAQLVKVKKALVVAHLAEHTAELESAKLAEASKLEEAGEIVIKQDQAELPAEDDKASKLAAMLAGANAKPQEEAVPATDAKTHTKGGNMKFTTSSSKNEDGSNKQRRNTNVTTRKIAVFMSESRKEAFISTNLAFTVKTYDGAIKHIKQAKQKALQAMFLEADFKMELRDQEVHIGAELNDAKGELHDILNREGWSVVGSRPKTSFERDSRLPALPVQEEAPAEEATA